MGNPVLERLFSYVISAQVANNLDATLIPLLEERRYNARGRGRGQQGHGAGEVVVEPVKSYSQESASDSEDLEDDASPDAHVM